jgi:hypothetical protein
MNDDYKAERKAVDTTRLSSYFWHWKQRQRFPTMCKYYVHTFVGKKNPAIHFFPMFSPTGSLYTGQDNKSNSKETSSCGHTDPKLSSLDNHRHRSTLHTCTYIHVHIHICTYICTYVHMYISTHRRKTRKRYLLYKLFSLSTTIR